MGNRWAYPEKCYFYGIHATLNERKQHVDFHACYRFPPSGGLPAPTSIYCWCGEFKPK